MRVVEVSLRSWSAEDGGLTVDDAFVVQEVGVGTGWVVIPE